MERAAEIIEDAYRHPRHRGTLPSATHRGREENPLCGDVVGIELEVRDGRIADARFDGRGCAISQASADLLLDRLIGQPVEAVPRQGRDEVLGDLGLPDIAPARLKCALLPLEAAKGAIADLGARR